LEMWVLDIAHFNTFAGYMLCCLIRFTEHSQAAEGHSGGHLGEVGDGHSDARPSPLQAHARPPDQHPADACRAVTQLLARAGSCCPAAPRLGGALWRHWAAVAACHLQHASWADQAEVAAVAPLGKRGQRHCPACICTKVFIRCRLVAKQVSSQETVSYCLLTT